MGKGKRNFMTIKDKENQRTKKLWKKRESKNSEKEKKTKDGKIISEKK